MSKKEQSNFRNNASIVSGNVLRELNEATKKFGKFNSAHEGYAVLKEEVDEMWDEIKRNNIELACLEAMQVAAMAIRFIVDCNPNKQSQSRMEAKNNDN